MGHVAGNGVQVCPSSFQRNATLGVVLAQGELVFNSGQASPVILLLSACTALANCCPTPRSDSRNIGQGSGTTRASKSMITSQI